MSARYIIRLDDACQTMDHNKWDYLENIFDELNIKPLVAVIPDNIDKSLNLKESSNSFWEKVLCWQNKGWVMGLHGYQHDMHTTNAKQIFPFYKRSEFSGLSLEEQSFKINKGYKILQNKGINPSVWIAPAHCFDKLTLEAIALKTSIKIISDGIAFDHYYENGFHWIPQQLWDFKQKRSGLWTICIHPNSLTIDSMQAFKDNIFKFKDQIISIDDLDLIKNKKTILDKIFSFYFWTKYKMIIYLSSFKKSLKK